jgi:hypothetical protein
MADESLGNLQDRQVALERQLRTKQEIGAAESDILAIKKQLLDVEKGIAEKQGSEVTDQYLVDLERRRLALEEQIGAMERSSKASQDFDNALKRNIKTLTGITDSSDSLIGSFMNLTKETGGVGAALEQMGETLAETINAQNVATSIATKFAEGTMLMATAIDSATAGFAKATGLGKTFNSQIIALEASNRKFGVSASESAASFESLVGGLSGFTLMGEDVQSALATEVAQLSELGVSAADTTGVFESLTRTFGFTATESIELTKQTETLAQELGISLGEAVGNLNAALPQLASLSANQVGPAFEALQKRAVETGLAVNDLVGIAGRFDTFDSAASAAGNLNAVLGTQMFDTMGLLEAQLEGPDAVIEQLRQGLLGSVGSFEELTVFQRKAIANASGLNEEEIRGLFNSKEVTEEQKKQADEREKNLKAAMDLKAELMALVAEMSVAIQPLMTLAKNIVSAFASITKAIKAVMGEGTIGNIGAAGVMIAGGALIGKGVSAAMSALGIGKKLGPGGVPRVYVDNMPGGGPGGGGDGGSRMSFGDRMSASRNTTKKRGGFFKRVGGAFKGARKGGKGFFGALGAAGKSGFRAMRSGGAGLISGALGKAGGLFKGIGKKVGLGGIAKLGAKVGLRGIPYLGQALRAYDVLGAGSRLLTGKKLPGALFNKGGGIAGTGPVPITAHGGEVVVPVEKTPAASNLANMVAERSSVNNKELIKEIRNLNNRPIKVTSEVKLKQQELGRAINDHFGAAGSKPANSVV